MSIEELKSQYIAGIYQTKAFLIKEKPFTLQSGKKSHLYLNHRHFLSDHRYLTLIANIYHKLLMEMNIDGMLGAVDSIMSPIIVGAMSSLFGLDYVVVRKSPLSHGTQEFIYGNVNKEVILIDDMTSTGDTLIDATEKIRIMGGVVTHAIISAYREPTALQNLKAKNIETKSIASFAEIIKNLQPMLSSAEREIVEKNPSIFD